MPENHPQVYSIRPGGNQFHNQVDVGWNPACSSCETWGESVPVELLWRLNETRNEKWLIQSLAHVYFIMTVLMVAAGAEGKVLTVTSRAATHYQFRFTWLMGPRHLKANLLGQDWWRDWRHVGQSLPKLQLSIAGGGRREAQRHRQLISPPTETATGSQWRVRRHISDQLAHTRSRSRVVTEQEQSWGLLTPSLALLPFCWSSFILLMSRMQENHPYLTPSFPHCPCYRHTDLSC